MNKIIGEKMNKKHILIISIVIAALTVGWVYYYFNFGQGAFSSVTLAQQQGQPVRSAELKGYIRSIEGNELIIINEISTGTELTDAEKAARKAERAQLTQEERRALKGEESATLQKEDVKIVIPVGVMVKKATGDTSGSLVDGDLSEIKEGSYVSIWVQNYKESNHSVEFVKIMGAI